MALKQYYLLNKPDDITSSSYQTYPCVNRFFKIINNTTKLFNYNQLYNYEISGSVPDNDSYKDKYIYNNYSFVKGVNTHIVDTYKQAELVMPILYLYDLDNPGDKKYFNNNSTQLFGIPGIILIPEPLHWLYKYNSGGMRENNYSVDYTDPYYLEWCKPNATQGIIFAYTPSGTLISAISSSATSNYNFEVVSGTYNYYFKAYLSFKIGVGCLFNVSFHYDNDDIFYIGGSDYITFNPILILNNDNITTNAYNWAVYGFPKNTGKQTITYDIGNESGLTIAITLDSLVTLSVNSSGEYDLMNAFDNIMSSKYGGNYSIVNHTLYTNGVTHYFYLFELSYLIDNIIHAYHNSTFSNYVIPWVFTKYTSAPSEYDLNDFSCVVLDVYKYNNIIYLTHFGILTIDNLTYHYSINNSIPNQNIQTLINEYRYVSYDSFYGHNHNYENPDEKSIRKIYNLSDHTKIMDNAGSSYWCNTSTFDYTIGYPLLENTSYSYAYNG